MKKVFILGSAHPYKVGSAQFNERLAQEFKNEKYEIIIYTFKLQYPKFLFPGKSQYSDKEAPEDLIIKRKINTINPFNWFKIGLEIKKNKPDFIIIRYMMSFMSPSMGTISRIVKKNNFTKCIGLIDNAIPHEKRFFDTILSKYFFKSLDGFLYMSKKVGEDLSNFGFKSNKKYCPHPLFDNYGIKTDKIKAKNQLGLDKDYKYILFFGLIREYKGLDLLIEAIDHNYFKENKIKLLVAGEFYSDVNQYEKLINDKSLNDLIIINNKFIPNEDVSLYFSASDILVLPYKTATQSGVTQVGFYYNKPMLVTNVGGLGELIDSEIGYIVDPKAKAIQDALLDFFINNKEIYLSENVSKRKKMFSWKRMTDTFNEINNEN